MYVIKPLGPNGTLEEIEKNIYNLKFDKKRGLTRPLRPQSITLQLPKFNIQSEFNFEKIMTKVSYN